MKVSLCIPKISLAIRVIPSDRAERKLLVFWDLCVYVTSVCVCVCVRAGQASHFSSAMTGLHSATGPATGNGPSGYDIKRTTHNILAPPTSVVTGSHVIRDQRPDKNIKMTLDNRELWRKFHTLGTEMIITKSGRWAIRRLYLFNETNRVVTIFPKICLKYSAAKSRIKCHQISITLRSSLLRTLSA